MFAQERQQKIAELLNEQGSIKVSNISEVFNVSESTIRRDLQKMEKKGILTRTHGGAVRINWRSFEPSFRYKEDKHHNEKISIGKIAAEMIEDGDTIIIDSGTTNLEIAKNINLEIAKDITVITNSLDIASELTSKEGIELIVTGGSMRNTTRAMVGPITEGILKNFRVDKAFIGANGISVEEGVTTPNFVEAQTKKSIINVANKVILVVDNSKFNQVCFSVICSIREVFTIITNRGLNKNEIKNYEDLGVEIKVAEIR